jgi:hypothetical protein
MGTDMFLSTSATRMDSQLQLCGCIQELLSSSFNMKLLLSFSQLYDHIPPKNEKWREPQIMAEVVHGN